MMVESVIQIKNRITINNASVKNIISTYSCENGKYLASITEHTVIKRDETITKKNCSGNC